MPHDHDDDRSEARSAAGSDPAQTGAEHAPGLSRRSIIAASAGLGLGGALGVPPAVAQTGAVPGAAPGLAPGAARGPAHGLAAGGSLSNRIYSLNPAHPEMADIAENPANVPPPITRTEPTTVQIELETIELEGHLDANSLYRFWTFNGSVPGPMIRVRVGDTV